GPGRRRAGRRDRAPAPGTGHAGGDGGAVPGGRAARRGHRRGGRAHPPARRGRRGAGRPGVGHRPAAGQGPTGVRVRRGPVVLHRRHPGAGRAGGARRPPGRAAPGRRGRERGRPGLRVGHGHDRPRASRRPCRRRRPRSGGTGADPAERRDLRADRRRGARRRRRRPGGRCLRRSGGRVRRRGARPRAPGGRAPAARPGPLVPAVVDGDSAPRPGAGDRREGGARARPRPRPRRDRGGVGLRRRLDRRGAAVGAWALHDLAAGHVGTRGPLLGGERRRGPGAGGRGAGAGVAARARSRADPVRAHVAGGGAGRCHAGRPDDRLPDLRRPVRVPVAPVLPHHRRAAVQPEEAQGAPAHAGRRPRRRQEAGLTDRARGSRATAPRSRQRLRGRRGHPGRRGPDRAGLRAAESL
ncbi:MAG: FIG00945369: hypothetical protein, partial [uncultured Blastococcus sp.]